MGCCSCFCSTLTWVLAIIGNLGVFVLLGLSILYWQNWQAALGGSLVYLLILLITTSRYHSKEIANARQTSPNTLEAETRTQGENGEEHDSSSPNAGQRSRRNNKRIRLPVSLGLSIMYFITNLVFAVPGAIVVFFAFPCSDPDYDFQGNRQVYWKTNMTELSPAVQEWMESVKIGEGGSTFAQTSTTMYVYGSFEEQRDQLYAVEEVGVNPTPLGYDTEVHDVVAVTDSTICFVQSYDGYDRESSIFCGNAQIGFKEKKTARDRFSFGLEGINGVLWFLQISHEYFVFDPLRGGSCTYNQLAFCRGCAIPACRAETMKVMSMDVTTMEVTSHSRKYTTRHKNSRRRMQVDSAGFNETVTETFDETIDTTVNATDNASSNQTVGEQEVVENTQDGVAGDGNAGDGDTEGNDAGGNDVEDGENENGEAAQGYYEDDEYYEQDKDENFDKEEDPADDQEEITEEDEGIFCDGNMMTSLRALAAIFVSVLPTVFNSARIWVRYAVPSSSVTLFLGLGYGVFCIFGFFNNQNASVGFGLWLMVGTPIWTLVCTYQLVVNPRVTKAPLWWSLYLITTGLTGALAYQTVFEVTGIRAFDGSELVTWIMDGIFVHFPLLIISILTKSVYISLLTIIGFLLLTTIMIWKLTDDMSDTFLYGGIAYGATLFLALILFCMRRSLHRLFYGWLSACARHTCAIEVEDDDEDNENTTTGLLLNENAEDA